MRDTAQDPPDIALQDRPSVARMYDYYLDGSHNFAVDREAAEQVITLNPDVRFVAQANRAFLRRAVTFLVEQGTAQFLDIGSGIPTAGNVHEIAQGVNPEARVVYVDSDPVAVAHSRTILRDNSRAVIIQADARHPEQILSLPEFRHLLDLDQPVAVIFAALLHFVADDGEARRVVCALRDAVAPGSFLALSHGTNEYLPREVIERGERLYTRTAHPLRLRSRDEIAMFFDGWELIDPGLVYAPCWRPERPDDLFLDRPERSSSFVGVGRKPR